MWSSGQRGPATSCWVCRSDDAERRGLLRRDTPRTRRALRDLHRGGGVVGVRVGHLGLRDLAGLVLGQSTDLLLVGYAGPLLQAGGFLDQLGRGRGLGDERERTVFVDGDLDRDHVAA